MWLRPLQIKRSDRDLYLNCILIGQQQHQQQFFMQQFCHFFHIFAFGDTLIVVREFFRIGIGNELKLNIVIWEI